MDKLMNALTGNWRTTAAGFALAFLAYATQNGATFPTTKQEWGNAALAAGLAALGLAAKDSNVGSKAK